MTTTKRNLLWAVGSLAALLLVITAADLLLLGAGMRLYRTMHSAATGAASQTEGQRLNGVPETRGTPPATLELDPPFRAEVDGKPIDVEVGHAAPLLADFDGDGLPDLLVGQFGKGRLNIFRNTGTATQPRFAAGKLFEAGGREGTVPAG